MGKVQHRPGFIKRFKKWFSLYVIGSSASAVLILLFYLYFQISVETITGKSDIVAVHYLPDNSRVVLNNSSELRYNRYNTEASMTLRGEAYFEVNKASELKIKTAQGEVLVNGTRFHIVENADGLNVVCYDGKLSVKYGKEERQLLKGEQFIGFADGYAIGNTDVIDSPNFTKFLKSYNNENIQTVFAELGSFFGIDIKFDKLFDSSYSGMLNVANYRDALDMVCNAQKLNYFVNNRNQIVVQDFK